MNLGSTVPTAPIANIVREWRFDPLQSGTGNIAEIERVIVHNSDTDDGCNDDRVLGEGIFRTVIVRC